MNFDTSVEPTSVVLFQAHEVSVETLAAYEALRRLAGKNYQVRILLDIKNSADLPSEFAGEAFLFNSGEFDKWGFPVLGGSMLPGHCHFPILKFFQCNPKISQLWLIEYDVRFTGEWSYFLDYFKDDDADLLCSHLRHFSEEPAWFWWDSLEVPAEYLCEVSQGKDLLRLRSFLVVARYSAAAMRAIIKATLDGWKGHQEVIIPTAIAQAGLKIRDLNGRGVNCESRIKAKSFYTSYSDLQGALEEFGTMRYRPSSKSPGRYRNKLYHPVKPSSMASTKTAVGAFRSKLRALMRLGKAALYRLAS